MHKLAVRLPPFSPDYSGVCSALFELGGMMVIHDASGCTGNYTGYDEPRWYDSGSLVYCSALREIDAILGNDRKFIENIAAAAAELEPKFICMLGSPVPMVIGSDIKGIAAEIEVRTGIPTLGFATTGLQYYDRGAADAFLALARRFVTQAHGKKPHTINLLGATPLDLGAGHNLRDFCREFELRGSEVVSTFAMDCDMEQICHSSAAAVNVVLSASGLALAEHFHKAFGTPFVIGQPMGKKQAEKLCQLLEKAEQTGENMINKVPAAANAHLLLIGEQVTMHSLRACLYNDFGLIGCDIGCPFNKIPQLAAASDMVLASEKAIISAINSGKYTHIIGDPLLRELIRRPLRFIPLSHIAVSSKIHWHEPPELAGEKIMNLLKGVM
ncbi:MAG: nitrogenase component 1 [Syntrophomonadaceae bacterium]|nr:nitrogenase component 1 [Syntrophomonadaceae bacterium]